MEEYKTDEQYMACREFVQERAALRLWNRT